MKLKTDVSNYQNYMVPGDYQVLKDHTDGITIKIGSGDWLDPYHQKHIDQSAQVGLPYNGYWWLDPTKGINQTVDKIVQTTRSLGLPSIELDIEQHWKVWNQYFDMLAGRIPGTELLIFTPTELLNFYTKVVNQVRAELNPIPVGTYSADWFIQKYCPGLAPAIYQADYWEARYLRWYNAAQFTAMKNQLGTPFSITKVRDFEAIAPIVRGQARQFETYLQVKELPHLWNFDWSFVTDQQYARLFDKAQQPQPEPPMPEIPAEEPGPEPTQVVTKIAVRIRQGPSTDTPTVGWLTIGSICAILEISGEWGRTEKGWIWMGATKTIQGTYQVTALVLNVRGGPGTGYPITGKKYKGQFVTVTDITNRFGYIRTGWVSMDWIQPAAIK